MLNNYIIIKGSVLFFKIKNFFKIIKIFWGRDVKLSKNVKYQPDILMVQLQYKMKRLMNPHQTFFLPLFFLGNPPILPNSFFWETHQLFLLHFLGKPTNFSYLIFLRNPHFFLAHFFGKPTIFLPHLKNQVDLPSILKGFPIMEFPDDIITLSTNEQPPF